MTPFPKAGITGQCKCSDEVRDITILVCLLTLQFSSFYHRIPATMIITFFLTGIEELGLQLEEPFGVLYVYSTCFIFHIYCALNRTQKAVFVFVFFVFHWKYRPMHKISNGIGLSAEEHVKWMTNDIERLESQQVVSTLN